MYVRLSDNDFRKPRHMKLIFAHPVYLYGIRVKVIYEGHRVSVKVTGVEKVTNACACIDQRRLTIFIRIRQMSPVACGPALD